MLSQGLIFHWQPGLRSQSGVAVDRKQRLSGYIKDTALPYAGRYGYGLDIQGSSSTTENGVRFDNYGPTVNPSILSVWVMYSPDTLANSWDGSVISKYDPASALSGWTLTQTAFSNNITVIVADGSGRNLLGINQSGLAGSLVQAGFTYDLTSITGYLNGRATGSTACTRTLEAAGRSLMIGNSSRNSTTTQGSFDGKVFAAAIWNRNIGETAFRALFANPFGLMSRARRRAYSIPSGGPAFNAAWASQRSRIIGAGV
jgi:hypothetical protein